MKAEVLVWRFRCETEGHRGPAPCPEQVEQTNSRQDSIVIVVPVDLYCIYYDHFRYYILLYIKTIGSTGRGGRPMASQGLVQNLQNFYEQISSTCREGQERVDQNLNGHTLNALIRSVKLLGLATGALAIGNEISRIDPIAPMLQCLTYNRTNLVVFACRLRCESLSQSQQSFQIVLTSNTSLGSHALHTPRNLTIIIRAPTTLKNRQYH